MKTVDRMAQTQICPNSGVQYPIEALIDVCTDKQCGHYLGIVRGSGALMTVMCSCPDQDHRQDDTIH